MQDNDEYQVSPSKERRTSGSIVQQILPHMAIVFRYETPEFKADRNVSEISII